ncbi:MAG TPA: DUF1918 domain-containing protein [Acidimicrobiales bacterium]|nr:DUF1918 domain-containing protein [Acidimicrobiales bacterium]
MAGLGDRVQVPSKKVGQAPREGVVVGVSGSLLTVRWSTGEESAIMPSMGSLVVVGKARGHGATAARATKSPSKKAATAARRSATSGATPAKSAPRTSPAGKGAGAKKSSSKGSARKPKKGK